MEVDKTLQTDLQSNRNIFRRMIGEGWSWSGVTSYIMYILSILIVFISLGWICNLERDTLHFPGLNSSKINIVAAISVLCGLLTLTLLRICNSSNTSLYGILLTIAGLFTTIYATTLIHFVASYGIIETYHVKDENVLLFPNIITAFALALYGIGASLFRDLQLSFQENFTSSDGSFIFIMIIGNLITAMTFLQPVIVSMKEISIKYSRDGEYLPLDKNEFDRNQTKSHKTCSVALFADMKFITILIGLSIAFFVEFAFQWMLPYFLMESNFSIEETATFLSICAVVEIWFRLLAPYIASFFNQQNYFMFIIAVVILFAVRIIFIFVANYKGLLFFSIIIGACKGLLFVYWVTVIPELAPRNELTLSFGLLFICSGLCMYLITPVLDSLFIAYEDFATCVMFLNYLSLIVIAIFAFGTG